VSRCQSCCRCHAGVSHSRIGGCRHSLYFGSDGSGILLQCHRSLQARYRGSSHEGRHCTTNNGLHQGRHQRGSAARYCFRPLIVGVRERRLDDVARYNVFCLKRHKRRGQVRFFCRQRTDARGMRQYVASYESPLVFVQSVTESLFPPHRLKSEGTPIDE
jgi:hypothetical protein